MLFFKLKSKISYARVTDTQLDYEGSITIGRDIIEKAGLFAGEKVEVLNMNNGSRFQTYVIEGDSGTGPICLNGPAARLGLKGDKLIILAYCLLSRQEVSSHKAEYVVMDEDNKIEKNFRK